MPDTRYATTEKMIGMYVHQHWPYNHPYCARTWTEADWRGYAGALARLGYNTILVWPVLETIPDPPTPSDIASLQKHSRVIDMLHHDYGMRVYIALCPNVAPDDAAASQATFESRHFFSCDLRVNPGDPAAMQAMLKRRERLLGVLSNADGVCIIDSDPGGYVGSTNQEFVDLLLAHRRLLDTLRPGIELIYWMHAGWLGYNRFYETGVLTYSTDEENLDVLRRLASANPEPWGLANGLALAEQLGIAHRVISFNYGHIEGEPSFPLTNFGGDGAWNAGAAPGPRGVMGNAQTHCVQLPNTFAFARGAQGLPVDEEDYIAFADEALPGLGETVVRAWTALSGTDPAAMRTSADAVEAAATQAPAEGPLSGLLFGDATRFLKDLSLMLRMRAAYRELQEGEGQVERRRLRAFTVAAAAWQARHGYKNTWWWPDLEQTLHRIGSAEVNALLARQFDPFRVPPLQAGTAFAYVASLLRETESHTPRLLDALRRAAE